MRECPNCGTSLEGEKTDKLYCSDACRSAYRRLRLKALGACTVCGTRVEEGEGYVNCKGCRKESAKRSATHYRKKKEEGEQT